MAEHSHVTEWHTSPHWHSACLPQSSPQQLLCDSFKSSSSSFGLLSPIRRKTHRVSLLTRPKGTSAVSFPSSQPQAHRHKSRENGNGSGRLLRSHTIRQTHLACCVCVCVWRWGSFFFTCSFSFSMCLYTTIAFNHYQWLNSVSNCVQNLPESGFGLEVLPAFTVFSLPTLTRCLLTHLLCFFLIL